MQRAVEVEVEEVVQALPPPLPPPVATVLLPPLLPPTVAVVRQSTQAQAKEDTYPPDLAHRLTNTSRPIHQAIMFPPPNLGITAIAALATTTTDTCRMAPLTHTIVATAIIADRVGIITTPTDIPAHGGLDLEQL